MIPAPLSNGDTRFSKSICAASNQARCYTRIRGVVSVSAAHELCDHRVSNVGFNSAATQTSRHPARPRL